MSLGSLHTIDLCIVCAYLAAVIWMGRRSAAAVHDEEFFFLAGRKLGKFYQFFLNFGSATEPQGAVSTVSFVYQQGAPGSWLSFQTVFMNPYFWFMNVWYRRVRLTTLSDLLEERYASRGLSLFYAAFQILVVGVLIGFGNVTAYKIASSLVLKEEMRWTAAERTSVSDYYQLKQLEKLAAAGILPATHRSTLATLRDRDARGELHSYVTALDELLFYAGFSMVIGTYIVLGGMTAAAINEGLQSVLIIIFSVLLIPTGLHAAGGWSALSEKVPRKMFDLFGSAATEQFSAWGLVAILLVSTVQNSGLSHNMGIYGSARNEFAARWGVSGTYLKRLMIVLWAFTGLIAVAMFGPGGLSDPDSAWGAMSNLLLGPGLIGLMLAGVIAGTMSTLAAKALAISSLFVRNVYRQIWPDMSQQRGVFCARCTIVAVLALGAFSAWLMGDFLSIMNLVLTINLPFGAVVLLTFLWRRTTVQAAWACVILTMVTVLVIPWTASHIPALASHLDLTRITTAPSGRPSPIYFDRVVRSDPSDPASSLVAGCGLNRFNFECWLIGQIGIDIGRLSLTQRLTAQFFVDSLFPFVVLLAVSLLTPPTNPKRVAWFYGKMKTPVGDTPELEFAAMNETRRNPTRFDHTKLFPRSNWEFTKWDKVDTIGFLVCCALSCAIVGLFLALLHWASKDGTVG